MKVIECSHKVLGRSVVAWFEAVVALHKLLVVSE